MKIEHILAESILFEQQLREDPIYKSFYSVGTLLVEKQLSQQEIQGIFKSVADGAAAGGNVDKEGDAPASNRTLLGKGADVAGKINKAFDSVKTKISQSGPVSGFDVAFDNMQTKLLNAAGGEKGTIGKALAKYREFAHQHPVMQGAIYSGLIALAGISGAGLGGAALLGGIKVFDKLLQGNKASSALWSGFKTGAMAYGASKLGDYVRGQQQQAAVGGEEVMPVQGTEGMRIAGEPVVPGQPLSDTQMSVMKMSIDSGNTYPPEVMAQYNAQMSGAGNTAGDVGGSVAKAAQKGAAGSVKQGIDNATQAADTGAQAANLTPDFDPNNVPDGWTMKQGATPVDTGAITRGLGEPKGTNFGDDYLKKVIAGEQPRAMISPEDAQKALDWKAQNAGSVAPSVPSAPIGDGFSKEYLEKVISGQQPRPMISVEKAKQLLGQSYVNPKPMLEYIDREATVRSWALRESVGKSRGGVALTEAGRQAVFRAVVNEGPWDDIKQGAGKFVKGLGQGFTNPGVQNIKNMDASQMTGAKVGSVGNKLAKGYGKLAGVVQKGANAVGGVVKKGWDSAANKVTYDKLDLNWRKSYKEFDPTGGKGAVDSEVVADFLRKQGVKDGLISNVYKQLGIPVDGAQAQQPQAQAQQGQQTQVQAQTAPAQQGQAQPATGATATTADPTAPDANNLANKALGGVAGAIKGAQNAWERGVSTPIGQSLASPMPTTKTGRKTTGTQTTAAPMAQPATPGAAVPAVAPATATAPTATTAAAAATPAAKKHTGGKVAGQLSQTPGAIKKRQARAAAGAKAGAGAFGQMATQLGKAGAPAAPAPMKFGPGVGPQMTIAPSKVSYNMNLPKAAPAAPAKKAVQTAGKINGGNPVVEQIDIAEALWRKMKSKR